MDCGVRLGCAAFPTAWSAYRPRLVRLPDSLVTIRWRGVALNPVHSAIHPLCLRSYAARKPRLSIRDCSFEGLSPSSELFLAFSSASASPAPETEDESDAGGSWRGQGGISQPSVPDSPPPNRAPAPKTNSTGLEGGRKSASVDPKPRSVRLATLAS